MCEAMYLQNPDDFTTLTQAAAAAAARSWKALNMWLLKHFLCNLACNFFACFYLLIDDTLLINTAAKAHFCFLKVGR